MLNYRKYTTYHILFFFKFQVFSVIFLIFCTFLNKRKIFIPLKHEIFSNFLKLFAFFSDLINKQMLPIRASIR